MKIKEIKLHKPMKKNHFSKIAREIKDDSGVYLLFNNSLELIYIGATKGLRGRLLRHLSGSNVGWNNKILVPFGEVKYFSFVEINKQSERLMFESNLIKFFKPKYNTKKK